MSLDGWLRVDLIALAACENPLLQENLLEKLGAMRVKRGPPGQRRVSGEAGEAFGALLAHHQSTSRVQGEESDCLRLL